MPRTTAENRRVFLRKAALVKTQAHFEMIMALFPEELQQEIYDEVQPLLTAPLVWPPPIEE